MALILAAGASKRLGDLKQLVDWGGRPLLVHVIALARSWPVDGVAVVLGYQAEEILEEAELGEVVVVINPEWEEGVASSLRVGLAALAQDVRVEAAIIALGDQPNIDRTVVENLVHEYRVHRPKAMVPKYRYTRGNPVLVDQTIWPRLMSLRGDAGAKQLLAAHPEWVREVWVDQLPPRDIDTPADLSDLRPSSRQ